MRRGLWGVWLLVLLLTACQGGVQSRERNSVDSSAATVTLDQGSVPAAASPTRLPPTGSPTPLPHTPSALPPVQQPAITPQPQVEICSPLADILLAGLSALIANPYNPPRLGSDDPHQGVDFADIEPETRITLEGRSVQAILAGTVAGVVVDRFPYGNAVMIETSLDKIPEDRLDILDLPAPAPIADSHPILTCPTPQATPDWETSHRSLYILYAHMQSPPMLQPGKQLACGAKIGEIGATGNALNPHLHVEMRVGPAGARFDSLAHYTASASMDEMRSYCQWRVSQAFQLIDPMDLFAIQP